LSETKVIMKNWRTFLTEEQLLIEQIEREFTLLSESLTEWQDKGLLEEGIAQNLIGQVKKFSKWKNDKLASWLKPALEKLYNLSVKLRKAGKLPFTLGKQLRNLISDLMSPDNLALAASIISIVAGLLMGDIATNVGAIADLLDTISAAPSLIDAASNLANATDIKDAIEAGAKTTKLAGNVSTGGQ